MAASKDTQPWGPEDVSFDPEGRIVITNKDVLRKMVEALENSGTFSLRIHPWPPSGQTPIPGENEPLPDPADLPKGIVYGEKGPWPIYCIYPPSPNLLCICDLRIEFRFEERNTP